MNFRLKFGIREKSRPDLLMNFVRVKLRLKALQLEVSSKSNLNCSNFASPRISKGSLHPNRAPAHSQFAQKPRGRVDYKSLASKPKYL